MCEGRMIECVLCRFCECLVERIESVNLLMLSMEMILDKTKREFFMKIGLCPFKWRFLLEENDPVPLLRIFLIDYMLVFW